MAQPVPQNQSSAGTVIVVPQSKALIPLLHVMLDAHGYRVVMETPLSGTMAVAVPKGFENTVAGDIRLWPGVRSAGREALGSPGSACDAAPAVMPTPFDRPGPSSGNDIHFIDQWYLENTGQTIVNGSCSSDPLNTVPGVPGVDINIRKAWSITQGCESVVVAVLDTGVQYENPAFDPARFFFPDLAATCPSGTVADPWVCCEVVGPPYTHWFCEFGYAIDMGGHGTPVAATIGAMGNNHSGAMNCVEMAGVDLKCRILAVRTSIVNAFGTVPYNYFSEFATLYALETIATSPTYADVRVINMSYSFPCDTFPSPVYESIEDACQLLQSQNRVVVVLAGNIAGFANNCPTRWDSVITIAGIDNTGDRWSQPQNPPCNGFASAAGSSVDFCAPARGVLSAACDEGFGMTGTTPPPSPCGPSPPAYFTSGTSGAAPQVAGVVSLLFARADELGVSLTWQDVYDLLFHGSRRLAHWPGSERDDVFGWGLVDAYESLVALELLHYRYAHPHNRADLTDHNVPNTWRFGVADGVIDCDDRAFFITYAYPNAIVDKADFTTAGTTPGQAGYGVPDGLVTSHDSDYFLNVLFPTAYSGSCPP